MPTNLAPNAYVLIGKETTFGTAVAADKDVGLVQNLTWNETNNLTRTFSLASVNAQQIDFGRFEALGSLDIILQHGRMLEYLTGGAVTHSATDTPDIKHTYALADTLPSLTLEDGYNNATATSDIVLKYAGVKVLGGTISLDLDGELRARFDLAAKTVAVTSAPQASVISALQTFKAFHATLSVGVAGSEAAVADVQNFEITWNNVAGGAHAIYAFSDRLPQLIDANQRTIDMKATIGFVNYDEYRRFIGGQVNPLKVAPLNDDTSPGKSGLTFNVTNGVALASGRRQFFFDFSNMLYARFSNPTAIGGYVFVDIEAQAITVDDMYSYDNIVSGSWG